MQQEGKTDDILGLTITDGYEGPPDLFSDEEREELREILAKPVNEASDQLLKRASRYVPTDPAHPWRDAHVRSCAQRFLRDVVLAKWIKNHPHKPCSGIRVDDWGRPLCRWINSNNGVDGPWENPTHFLFYYYNTFAAYVEFGTTMNGYLKAFWNIDLA